jgi:putative acetyltransferase
MGPASFREVAPAGDTICARCISICRGGGSRLMREALRILREQGAAGCVVLGEPEYYSRFGFQADPNLILPEVPAEYFQAIAFGSGRPHGIVTYHEALSARD